jgi:hypothetical protein
VLLKANPEKLQAHVALWEQLGGLTPQQVYKVYVTYPVLATTGLALIKAR